MSGELFYINGEVSKMYTTQMDAARKGIITPQMKIVAKKNRWMWKNYVVLLLVEKW